MAGGSIAIAVGGGPDSTAGAIGGLPIVLGVVLGLLAFVTLVREMRSANAPSSPPPEWHED